MNLLPWPIPLSSVHVAPSGGGQRIGPGRDIPNEQASVFWQGAALVPFCEIRGGFSQDVGCRTNRVRDPLKNPLFSPQKLGKVRLVADSYVALEGSVKCWSVDGHLVGRADCFSFVAVMLHLFPTLEKACFSGDPGRAGPMLPTTLTQTCLQSEPVSRSSLGVEMGLAGTSSFPSLGLSFPTAPGGSPYGTC